MSQPHTCARCKGRTYTCARCRRVVPECEGCADDLPELCDDCWADSHAAELGELERLAPEAFVP